MTAVLFRIAMSAALAAGAWFSWEEADAAARRADARERIVTLQYADVAPDVDAQTSATVAYWLGRYDEVVADTDASATDAELLRTAANAAFRASQRDPRSGSREPGAAVQELDVVLQAYASALKASPRDLEAAYNYEYVARLRDRVARSQGKVKVAPAPGAAVAAGAMAGDLPAGPTIHGRPGSPPPDARMEDLQMLAPLDFGDREAQPEATPGAKRERKG